MSDETHTPPAVPEGMMPGRNGGFLYRGGNHGNRFGAGEKPAAIRQDLRKNIPAINAKMARAVASIERLIRARKQRYAEKAAKDGRELTEAEREEYPEALSDQERLLAALEKYGNYCAKFGIGQTFTETLGNGEDVPRGRLSPAEIRREVAELLNSQN